MFIILTYLYIVNYSPKIFRSNNNNLGQSPKLLLYIQEAPFLRNSLLRLTYKKENINTFCFFSCKNRILSYNQFIEFI